MAASPFPQERPDVTTPPAPDTTVQHPLLGPATVHHLITLPDGTQRAVCRSPKGEALLQDAAPAPAPHGLFGDLA